MEKRVSSSGAARGKARTEVHRITIDKMANGFAIKKHKRPIPGTSREAMMMSPMESDEEPQAFVKHAPAHKAVQAAMAEMHPSLPPAGMPDAGPPDVPGAGGAPPME
jgi:hypothetical protein